MHSLKTREEMAMPICCVCTEVTYTLRHIVIQLFTSASDSWGMKIVGLDSYTPHQLKPPNRRRPTSASPIKASPPVSLGLRRGVVSDIYKSSLLSPETHGKCKAPRRSSISGRWQTDLTKCVKLLKGKYCFGEGLAVTSAWIEFGGDKDVLTRRCVTACGRYWYRLRDRQ